MSWRKRDFGFIVGVGALLFVLILSTFRDKPKRTPDNERHHLFKESLANGEEREVVEKGCEQCHNNATRPLPPKHPPKEQCLICHAMQ